MLTAETTPEGIWRRFAAYPGADQMASLFALRALHDLYRSRCFKHVLEIGHGLGTITYLLAMWRPHSTEIIAVEDDPWCQAQARRNLGYLAGTGLWYDKVPSYAIADLVILDGPQMRPEQWEDCLAERAVVFVEGNRREQRRELEVALSETGRYFCRYNLKPPDRSKGVWIYKTDPTWTERRQSLGINILEGWRDLVARFRGQPIGKRKRG